MGKPGKFEIADKGTLFLDEIGDLSLDMQPKLLRVLESKEFERVGGTSVRRSDFRVVAATNRNLEQMVTDGSFREDLYYRLAVIPIEVPRLRDREVDTPLIAHHLLAKVCEANDVPLLRLEPSAEHALAAHDWPGNVRELRNVLERTVAQAEETTIGAADLPRLGPSIRGEGSARGPQSRGLRGAKEKAEDQTIREVLLECDLNKAEAARRLGIHRSLLYKKMRKYGIDT